MAVPESGIYGIWSADRLRIYVGSTGNLASRLASHRACAFLGCEIEVGLSLPGSTRSERHKIEDRIILALRGRGITVANLTNEENHRTHLRHTPEEYLEYAQRGLGQLTPEQRRENGRKGAATGAGVRALERLGAETRRANGLKGANARWHPI